MAGILLRSKCDTEDWPPNSSPEWLPSPGIRAMVSASLTRECWRKDLPICPGQTSPDVEVAGVQLTRRNLGQIDRSEMVSKGQETSPVSVRRYRVEGGV